MIGFEYVTSKIWAIKQENLQTILEIAARVNPSLSDVEARLGKKLENKNGSRVEGEVKVIDLIGPIVRYGDMFSDISGARSLSSLKAEFISAVNDPAVSSILFNIDSPGGEASGINEFAELVYNSRGVKPITSYVTDMACSAAYWIASATDKIICEETATLGSIGCVAVMRDTEEKDAKKGIKSIQFVSSNSPNKRPDIKTDDGKALIQEQIDSIGDIFIGKVARNRSTESKKMSFTDVVNDFGKGGVLIGKAAVKAGLADELGSFESTLDTLKNGAMTSIKEKETSMQEELKTKVEEGTVDKKAEVEVSTKAEVKDVPDHSKALAALETQNTELKNALAQFKNQFAEMEKANKEIKQAALKTKAESVALSLKDKMVPAQSESFVTDYIQAANDDENSPVEGYSRVERLVARWEATPDHGKTEEALVILDNNVGEATDDEKSMLAELDKKAIEFAAQQNKKAHLNN